MKKEKGHLIKNVLPGSIAEEMEICPGDILLEINGKQIEDVFDYHFLVNDDFLTVVIRKPDGEEWELEIEKEYSDDLGISFESNLMDGYRSCSNKCIFCFIDQMPKGMRDTLYFKDDDARLSYLQGNYVTLTNMSEQEARRICYYRLSPINISVHTTNPELRCKMLHNRFAGDKLKLLDLFYESELEMNGQIVLCKGFNDGKELDRSISDLEKYLPYMQSVSVVPVGLTDYREGLEKLEPFSKEDSEKVIDQIEAWQEKLYKKHGRRMIFASDEWYIVAGREFPEEEVYEGYMQIENGVGMCRSLITEFENELDTEKGDDRKYTVSLATGVSATGLMKRLAGLVKTKFPNVEINVYTIINDFFGHNITVAGLITGRDLVNQLKGKQLGERLLLPSSVLRSGEDVFLDDMTTGEVFNALQTKLRIVKSSGRSLLDAFLGNEDPNDINATDVNPYELKEL